MENIIKPSEFLYFKGFPLVGFDGDLIFGIKSEYGRSDAAVLWRGDSVSSGDRAVVVAETRDCVVGFVVNERLLFSLSNSSQKIQASILAMINGGDEAWVAGDGFELTCKFQNGLVHTTIKSSEKVVVFINNEVSSAKDAVLISPAEVILSIFSALSRFGVERHLRSMLFKVQPDVPWMSCVASLDGVMSLGENSILLHRLSRIFARCDASERAPATVSVIGAEKSHG